MRKDWKEDEKEEIKLLYYFVGNYVIQNPSYGRHQIYRPMRLVAPHNLVFYLHLHLLPG